MLSEQQKHSIDSVGFRVITKKLKTSADKDEASHDGRKQEALIALLSRWLFGFGWLAGWMVGGREDGWFVGWLGEQRGVSVVVCEYLNAGIEASEYKSCRDAVETGCSVIAGRGLSDCAGNNPRSGQTSCTINTSVDSFCLLSSSQLYLIPSIACPTIEILCAHLIGSGGKVNAKLISIVIHRITRNSSATLQCPLLRNNP